MPKSCGKKLQSKQKASQKIQHKEIMDGADRSKFKSQIPTGSLTSLPGPSQPDYDDQQLELDDHSSHPTTSPHVTQS